MTLQSEQPPADAPDEEVVQMTETRRCVVHRYNKENRLTAEDRCIRCGGQAYYDAVIRVDGKDKHLLFCRHHANEHAPKLEGETAVAVYDYRPFLLSQESSKTTTPIR